MNCPNCGGTIQPGSNRCVKCGSYIEPQQPAAPAAGEAPAQPAPGPAGAAAAGAAKSKLAAGLLGIFVGCLGVHRFYLGYTGIGVAILLLFVVGWILSFVCIGIPMVIAAELWGIIEGILILTGVIDKDAQGRPLQ